jgi:hypothetical protein
MVRSYCPAIIARRLWHQQRETDVDNQERDDCGHRGEMHVARKIVAAEHGRQFLELHRLPDRKTRQDDHNAGEKDPDIQRFLHGVIMREVVVREIEVQRRFDVRQHVARVNRKQLAAEAAGRKA